MSTNKKVSVIIPFYNQLDWLCEAIESVLGQTYNNIEVIVVNDGAGEDMELFLKKYGDKIIYVKQENQGPGAARNLGIKIASGDYVAFEDADDVWLPTKIAKQVEFMERTQAIWSHTGAYDWWPQSGELKANRSICRDYGDIYEQSLISIHIATPSVMIRRDMLTRNLNLRFSEIHRIGEDTRLYIGIAALYPLGLIEEPLVKIRQRGSNTYAQVLKRFDNRAKSYVEMKKEPGHFSRITMFIHWIYFVYNKILGTSSSRFKNFIGKCFWILPYSLERMYVRILARKSQKDASLLVKYNE